MELYKSMQSYIEKLNEELGKKINKDEIQSISEEDIKKMLDDISGNDKAES
jgi:DNA replication initiation complex subunit (GINS family)